MNLVDRIYWLAAVNRHQGITPAARAVAIEVAYRARDGKCWPAQTRIANDTGLSLASVKRGLRLLRDAGFLTVERRAHGDRADRLANRYAVVIPSSSTPNGVSPVTPRKASRGITSDPNGVSPVTPKHKKRTEKVSVTWKNDAFDVPDALLEKWRAAYPGVDVSQEIAKATCWYLSNPRKRKRDHGRFLNGWLSRAKPSVPADDYTMPAAQIAQLEKELLQ